MTGALDDGRIATLQALYRTSVPASKLLDNFASRRRDRKIIEVDRLEQIHPDVTRTEIIDILKKLDEFGLGHFLVGRRGAASRFEWDVTMQSVGKAALGEGVIEDVSGELDDEDAFPQTVHHEYRLRADFTAHIELPLDLSTREAVRLADFLKTLPFND